jgi:CheY-like chemotaxis protein/HPt (histidine-containing phosphotransfer) domain-containing protein
MNNPVIQQGDYPMLRNAYLLLVEDNLINQEFMPEILGNEGIQVDMVNNGAEAIEMISKKDYSAVLMDCEMPVMNGYDATRIIRADQRFADLPIIAMTGSSSAEDRERCLASGMNDHIDKPIDWELFFQTLVRWVKPQVDGLINTSQQASDTAPNFPQLTGVDMDYVRKQTGNNVEVYQKMLMLFRTNHTNDVELIRAAYQAGYIKTAEQIAHKFKGSAGSMAQNQLIELICELEQVLKQREDAALESLLEKTDVVLAVLINEINLIVPPSPNT